MTQEQLSKGKLYDSVIKALDKAKSELQTCYDSDNTIEIQRYNFTIICTVLNSLCVYLDLTELSKNIQSLIKDYIFKTTAEYTEKLKQL